MQSIVDFVSGMTTDEFPQIVKDWLAIARHPKFKRPYTELTFQPMLELLICFRQWLQNFYRFPRGCRIYSARTGHSQQHRN